MIPMNVIPQVTKSSPNPGGIGPPDSGPPGGVLGAEFTAALKGEMKGADPSAGSGLESVQSDALPFNNTIQPDASQFGGVGKGAPQVQVDPNPGEQVVPRGGGRGQAVSVQEVSPLKDGIAAEKAQLLTGQKGAVQSLTSAQQKRAGSATRDESREALAGASAQGINPALIPQLGIPAKGVTGEIREEAGSKGQKAPGFKSKGSELLQSALSAENISGKDASDAISRSSRDFLGGEMPQAESFSVDPRVRDLLSQSDLKVQSFELKQGAAPAATALAAAARSTAESAVPNRVSTEDFLSLRGVKKEKSSKGPMESRVDQSMMQAQPFGKLHLGPVLEAPVTQGTAGKSILSHDALNQITQQVSGMSQAKQDGEIKIRLKPDHLGELMMSVKTSGDKVAVQIKAQDHEAKKIIEDSLGRLKDSLSDQNLTLHKVDVVTQPSASQASDGSFQMDFGPQSQGNFGRNDSQHSQDSSSNGRQEFHYDERPVSSNLKSINPSWARRSGGAGGLDLIA